ncbi:hypothetical protein BDV12DRAFT_185861 [Aspergillus spectabilis]
MKKANLWHLGLTHRLGNIHKARCYSSIPERLHHELTSRQFPLFFDYLHPQPSHLLNLTLADLFPNLGSPSTIPTVLPIITRPSLLPPAHHLVYFPPQVTLTQLLADGTDTLHSPGAPFNRRLWAGGSVKFAATNKLLLDGRRAVCIEGIRDVIVKGQTGEEKIIVKIERRMDTVPDEETALDTRKRSWSDGQDMGAQASIIETRDLVFMRDKTVDQLDQDKLKFSQPSRAIKCNLAIGNIEYKNLAPVYVEEELTICGKPKSTKDNSSWDVWIEGKDGGLAVRGTPAMDDFWSLPPVSRTITALTFVESALVHSGTISYYLVPFVPKLVFKLRPELWRVCTPYLLTDPKLNFVFDLYFMYTYSSRLEFGSPRFSTPGSFFIYVLFIASVIMVTLILAFAYTYSQDNKGTKTMFFVVEIPTLLLPWARLALTFVMKGWYRASIELTGIVAAHLYDFLTRIYPTFGGGKNYIVTPAFLRRWFTRSLRGGQDRVYGRAYRPPNEDGDASSGWTSSVRNAWDSRGSGRRLGGN